MKSPSDSWLLIVRCNIIELLLKPVVVFWTEETNALDANSTRNTHKYAKCTNKNKAQVNNTNKQ